MKLEKLGVFNMWNKLKRYLITYRCECGVKLYPENTYEEVVDTIAGIECEREILCKNCNRRVGYWAYGSYEPPVDRYEEFYMWWHDLYYEKIKKLFKRKRKDDDIEF